MTTDTPQPSEIAIEAARKICAMLIGVNVAPCKAEPDVGEVIQHAIDVAVAPVEAERAQLEGLASTATRAAETETHNKQVWENRARECAAKLASQQITAKACREQRDEARVELSSCLEANRLLIERDKSARAAVRELHELVRLAHNEFNTIRARDGAPQHIDWYRGQPMQSDGCTHEWWDEMTERLNAANDKHAALAAAPEPEAEQ